MSKGTFWRIRPSGSSTLVIHPVQQLRKTVVAIDCVLRSEARLLYVCIVVAEELPDRFSLFAFLLRCDTHIRSARPSNGRFRGKPVMRPQSDEERDQLFAAFAGQVA